MDRSVDCSVIDRNTVPNLRKPYKLRWCTVITVPYRITVNRTVHRRVTTLIVREDSRVRGWQGCRGAQKIGTSHFYA